MSVPGDRVPDDGLEPARVFRTLPGHLVESWKGGMWLVVEDRPGQSALLLVTDSASTMPWAANEFEVAGDVSRGVTFRVRGTDKEFTARPKLLDRLHHWWTARWRGRRTVGVTGGIQGPSSRPSTAAASSPQPDPLQSAWAHPPARRRLRQSLRSAGLILAVALVLAMVIGWTAVNDVNWFWEPAEDGEGEGIAIAHLFVLGTAFLVLAGAVGIARFLGRWSILRRRPWRLADIKSSASKHLMLWEHAGPLGPRKYQVIPTLAPHARLRVAACRQLWFVEGRDGGLVAATPDFRTLVQLLPVRMAGPPHTADGLEPAQPFRTIPGRLLGSSNQGKWWLVLEDRPGHCALFVVTGTSKPRTPWATDEFEVAGDGSRRVIFRAPGTDKEFTARPSRLDRLHQWWTARSQGPRSVGLASAAHGPSSRPSTAAASPPQPHPAQSAWAHPRARRRIRQSLRSAGLLLGLALVLWMVIMWTAASDAAWFWEPLDSEDEWVPLGVLFAFGTVFLVVAGAVGIVRFLRRRSTLRRRPWRLADIATSASGQDVVLREHAGPLGPLDYGFTPTLAPQTRPRVLACRQLWFVEGHYGALLAATPDFRTIVQLKPARTARNSTAPPPTPPPSQGHWPAEAHEVGPSIARSRNGFAIASLVLGILWLYWIGSILALIFGYIALRQIRQSNGRQQGRRIATAGVVLGWVGVGLAALAVLGLAVGDADAVEDESVGHGDDARLDSLWDDCEAGGYDACDQLWQQSPSGSDYEEFGDTCGRRRPPGEWCAVWRGGGPRD